ncbi:hypothetical protein B2I21_08740 [Chryseobacterium mucoviscidosis]|nr:hypothetical protein B2I21_08740 [Chryseobacterium mucoviscidosis]
MAYFHGIRTQEKEFVPPTTVGNNFQTVVAIGTSPVNMSTLPAPAATPVNQLVVARTYDEAVSALGFSDDFASYTLSEVIYSHFKLYRQGSPLVLINVLDPATHTEIVPAAPVQLVKRRVTIDDPGIVLSTLVVKSADGTTTYTANTDYTASFDTKGNVLLIARNGGTIPSDVNTLSVNYTKLDPTKVTDEDIIGGFDETTGKRSGIELIEEVLPKYQVIPDKLIIPGYSSDPLIASAMLSKASDISGILKSGIIVDLPADSTVSAAIEWKNDNDYNSSRMIAAYPKGRYKGVVYNLSTLIAGTSVTAAAANDGVPADSPSNKPIMVDSLVRADGTEIVITKAQADQLNSNGIVTALNFTGTYTAWGNRTAAYPTSTDPQNSFIPVRDMFDWIQNNFIVQYWDRVDDRQIRRKVAAIVDDGNVWLNGLTAAGYLLGGSLEFVEADNPLNDLLNGKIVIRFKITPPNPMEDILGTFEYDLSNLVAAFTTA